MDPLFLVSAWGVEREALEATGGRSTAAQTRSHKRNKIWRKGNRRLVSPSLALAVTWVGNLDRGVLEERQVEVHS
jgi:hypothetical protein